MRIGIDCLYADPNYCGGINTYLFGLLSGFAQVGTKHQFVLFCSDANKLLFEKFRRHHNFSVIVIPTKRNIIIRKLVAIAGSLNNTRLWTILMNIIMRNTERIVNQACDILYCPNTVLSIYNYKIPTLLSMHDIQQYHFPEFFTREELLLRKVTFEASALHATFFQASSQFIKDDLLTHFQNLKSDQISVIPEGVDIKTFQKPLKNLPDVHLKYALSEKYLYFPAQLWKHKNHITVLKALENISRTRGIQLPLVMTGAKYSAYDEIMAFIESNNMNYVRYLGKVDFEELIALYRNAHFMISSVLYESSSLPILEACASGTPVIASRTAPNVEMSKKLKLNLFEPTDVDALVNLILSIWDDDTKRKNQIDFNSENIYLYSWENIAKLYFDLIELKIR